MSVEEVGSITPWLHYLKEGREVDAATRALWDRYFGRLVRLAQARLSKAARGRADEEDVALSVLDGVCRGIAEGHFPRLDDREDLWRLLVTITARKASNLRRDESRQKRGGGRTVGEGALADLGDDLAGSPLDQIASAEPTPADAAMVVEEMDRLFGLLADDTLRRIARMKLEGYLNAEVRDRLGLSLRAVERKLDLIRKRWGQEGPG